MRDRVRLGVIGLGHWGPNLLRAFSELESVDIVAIADMDDSRLERARLRFPNARRGTDGAEIIESSDVDAVVVATPTTSHWHLVRLALLHDKHVFVEKPLAATVAEATDLADLARQRGRVLAVGHVFLFNDAVVAVKGMLDAGDLGDIYHVAAIRSNLGPVRTDVNAAWDLAAHDVSITNYWFSSLPTHVSAVGHAWLNPGIEDAVFATLVYPGNVLVNLHCSWLNPRKVRDYSLVGAKRMLTWNDLDTGEPIRIFDKSVVSPQSEADAEDYATFRSLVREGDIVSPRITQREPLMLECRAFVNDIRDSREPINGGSFAIGVTKVLAAISSSIASGGARVGVEL